MELQPVQVLCACIISLISSVQFSHSYPNLFDPMDCSLPGFPVHHQLPELTQTQVHQIGDAIHPSHPQWVSASHQVAKVLEFQLQHQSFHWIFRTDFLWMDWLDLLAVHGTLKSLLQHHSSKASVLQHSAFFMVQLSHPYMTPGKATRGNFFVFLNFIAVKFT